MAYIDTSKITIPKRFFENLDTPKLLDWLNSQPTADVVDKEKFAKEIFTKLYAHIKYDGHTVSVWKNDLISIAKQYGVDLDCEAIMDRGK